MELQRASTEPSRTIEEMATALLDMTDADQAALSRATDAELAAFEEYASTYAFLRPVFVCKGCHGG
jgi:hypothetical protein